MLCVYEYVCVCVWGVGGRIAEGSEGREESGRREGGRESEGRRVVKVWCSYSFTPQPIIPKSLTA